MNPGHDVHTQNQITITKKHTAMYIDCRCILIFCMSIRRGHRSNIYSYINISLDKVGASTRLLLYKNYLFQSILQTASTVFTAFLTFQLMSKPPCIPPIKTNVWNLILDCRKKTGNLNEIIHVLVQCSVNAGLFIKSTAPSLSDDVHQRRGMMTLPRVQ